MDDEKEIEKIGSCFAWITGANKEFGNNLARMVDLDLLKEKINQNERVDQIGFCIGRIYEANKDIGNSLINMIDLDSLKKKSPRKPINIMLTFVLNNYLAMAMILVRISATYLDRSTFTFLHIIG